MLIVCCLFLSCFPCCWTYVCGFGRPEANVTKISSDKQPTHNNQYKCIPNGFMCLRPVSNKLQSLSQLKIDHNHHMVDCTDSSLHHYIHQCTYESYIVQTGIVHRTDHRTHVSYTARTTAHMYRTLRGTPRKSLYTCFVHSNRSARSQLTINIGSHGFQI